MRQRSTEGKERGNERICDSCIVEREISRIIDADKRLEWFEGPHVIANDVVSKIINNFQSNHEARSRLANVPAKDTLVHDFRTGMLVKLLALLLHEAFANFNDRVVGSIVNFWITLLDE